MILSLQTKLSLYPLQIRADIKHFIVEEEVSGDFFEMPKICIDAIELINKGASLGEIEQNLLETYPADEVDIIDFADQLVELGLVKEIDGEEVTIKKETQRARGFEWMSPAIGRIFFNKLSNKLYMILLLFNVLLFIWKPELLPNYNDIFLFDSIIMSIVTYMAISLAFIIIHEFGHVLAIRSFGLPTKISIGHRLFFVVFETDLTPAWKLSSRQRNTLYFAGMAFEQVILSIALLVTLYVGDVQGSMLTGILAIAIFDIMVKTIYQCCFYMKTDLYYVVENITGCYNLMENGKQYLSKWIPFMKQKNLTETFKDEIKAVRLYSIFYVTGVLLTFGLFVGYFIPQVIYTFAHITG